MSPSPSGNFQRNLFYKTDEEYLFAISLMLVDEKYKAIVDAGCHGQIDDPGWSPTTGVFPMNDDRRNGANGPAFQVEAVNHALHVFADSPASHLLGHRHGPTGSGDGVQGPCRWYCLR